MASIKPYRAEFTDHFEERLSHLTADSERIFGTMDSTNMLRHIRKSFEAAVRTMSKISVNL